MSSFLTIEMDPPPPPRRSILQPILILGGRGFMGRLLVQRLLSRHQQQQQQERDEEDEEAVQVDVGVDGTMHRRHRNTTRKEDTPILRVWAACRQERPYWVHDEENNNTKRRREDEEVAHPSIDQTSSSSSSSASFVTWLRLDWEDPLSIQQCAAELRRVFDTLSSSSTLLVQPWSIVDFSCCEPAHVELWIAALRNPCLSRSHSRRTHDDDNDDGRAAVPIGHYIYVSTDSVYQERCVGFEERRCPEDDEGEESVAFLSRIDESATTVEWQRKWRRKRSLCYGEEKMAVEELLRQQTQSSEIAITTRNPSLIASLTVLRLPDVIGPWDRTGRFWATLLYEIAYWADPANLSLTIPSSLANQHISVVYGPDVADAIGQLLTHGPPFLEDVEGHGDHHLPHHNNNRMIMMIAMPCWSYRVFHLACSESPTLQQFTRMMLQQPDALHLIECESDASCDYYPSVSCGPLSIERAVRELHWSPTPLVQAVAATRAFFLEAMAQRQYLSECSAAMKKLPYRVRRVLRGQCLLPMLSSSSSSSSSCSTDSSGGSESD